MAAVSVGDVFRLRNSDRFGLVIFVRAESDKRCEDLRIVPIYTESEVIASATHRDLVIPASENSLGLEMLIAAWNGRGLDSTYLGARIGSVKPQVVEATRCVELSSIIPGLDLDVAAKWLGLRPKGKAALERAADFQVSEAAAWDVVERNLTPCEDLQMIVFKQNTFIGTLRRSVWTAAGAAGAFITHSLELEGALPAFSGEVTGVGQPPGPHSSAPTASRTAPNGAVLVSDIETLPVPVSASI